MRDEERERVKEIACVRMCVRVCICVYVWPCQSKRQRCSFKRLCICVSVCICVCVCVCVAHACPLSQICIARARSLCVYAQDTGHTHSYIFLHILTHSYSLLTLSNLSLRSLFCPRSPPLLFSFSLFYACARSNPK